METSEILKKLLEEDFGIRADSAGPDSRFVELGFDSLDILELTMLVEETFDIELTDPEAEACETLQQAVTLIDSKVNAGLAGV